MAHSSRPSKGKFKVKYIMLRVCIVSWFLYLIYIVAHIIKMKPDVFMNINISPYVAVLGVSFVILTGAIISAAISYLGKKSPELLQGWPFSCPTNAENSSRQEIDAQPFHGLILAFRKLSFAGFGIFAVVLACTFLTYILSIKNNTMYTIYKTLDEVDGFSYSENHRFDLEYYSEMSPARTEFFHAVNGDYASREDALDATVRMGFDQIDNGQRVGGVSCLAETYVEKEDDVYDAYMCIPTENTVLYDKETLSHNLIIKPSELFAYLSSADYARTEDYQGHECELYKTTVYSSSLENYFRAELRAYMGIYDRINFFYEYGLADGTVVPLSWWMQEESERYKGDLSGVKMSIWIEKEQKQVVHAELDATDLGGQLIEELFGDRAKKITVSYLGIELDYKDYGRKEIVIPEETIKYTEH